MFTKKNIILYCILVFSILITFFSSDFPFFWDNLSHCSRTAHWYYENGFSKLILPSEMDTGNPTLSGYYLAIVWTIFGKTLAISHWAFFPFIFLTIWQYYRLSEKVLPSSLVPLSIVLLAIDPTFLAQGMLMSPDVILISLFLCAVNSIIDGKRGILTLVLSFLCLISLRAVLSCVVLVFFDYYYSLFVEKKKINLKFIYNYIPFIIIISAWFLYHYFETGWLTFHKDSPWAGNFKSGGVLDILRNIVILIWRMIDFGRIYLWIYIFLIIGIFFKKINFTDPRLKIILGLFFCFLLVFFLPFILFNNLIAHHYLIVLYILTLFLFLYFIDFVKNKLRKTSIILAIIFLLSGNFWVYPDGIAKGWDSSLAFIPFFELKEKMNGYLTENKLDYSSIGTHAPNIHYGKYYNLESSDFRHVNLTDEKMENLPYVIESNICNDFSDNDLKLLKTQWILQKEYSKGSVYMRLYKNKKSL